MLTNIFKVTSVIHCKKKEHLSIQTHAATLTQPTSTYSF